MKRFVVPVALALVMLAAGYLLRGAVRTGAGAAGVPTVAASVDFIRQIGELRVLRASVKEIVTPPPGAASWFKTPGKAAAICQFDVTCAYDLGKARVIGGSLEDGTRYCVIRLPRHGTEIAAGDIRFFDDQSGSWLGFTEKTPPEEKARVLDAARRQAETQAQAFLGGLEGDIQASARAMVTQVAKAFGYTDIRVEFER
jgi:hypothetical protein